MYRYIKIFSATLIVLVGYSCQETGKIEETSSQTNEKQRDTSETYERIVSLNGAISEILCQLGQEEHIVATDITSNFPASLEEKPKVGHNRNISAEGVLAQSPDLIIGMQNELDGRVLDQIKSGGAKVLLFQQDYTIEGVKSLAADLRDSLKLDQDLGALNKLIEEPLKELKPFIDKPKVVFIYARGAGTLMVGGKNTSVDKMITLAGAQNAFNEFDGYKPLTAEAMAKADPDALLLFNSGLQSLEGTPGLMEIPGVSQTKAAHRGAFIAMEGQYLAGFGPRLGKAAKELNKKLHEAIQGEE
jgi:iron complex transport system substrate-binding protein